jgi:hypothetical protein
VSSDSSLQYVRTPEHHGLHFERDSLRITAIEIHDWIYEKMDLPGQEVLMTQVDEAKRQVYIKIRKEDIFRWHHYAYKDTLTYAYK